MSAGLFQPGPEGCDPVGLVSQPHARMLLLETDTELVETLHVALQLLRLHPFQAGVEQGLDQKPDIALQIDDVDVRRFRSQGQQRTAALALKLAEVQVMTAATPIMMSTG